MSSVAVPSIKDVVIMSYLKILKLLTQGMMQFFTAAYTVNTKLSCQETFAALLQTVILS